MGYELSEDEIDDIRSMCVLRNQLVHDVHIYDLTCIAFAIDIEDIYLTILKFNNLMKKYLSNRTTAGFSINEDKDTFDRLEDISD